METSILGREITNRTNDEDAIATWNSGNKRSHDYGIILVIRQWIGKHGYINELGTYACINITTKVLAT